MEEPVWTFERFEPGQVFGEIAIEMDSEKRECWQRIYGVSSDSRLPSGMLVAAMMEAYIRAIQPRPKGNVHASQMLDLKPVALDWGQTVTFEISCRSKQERKGRYWVEFGAVASSAGVEIMSGTIRSIWAA